MTPTSIYVRPISEATQMSIHCFRAQLFRVFNKLYIDNGSHLSSYEFVVGVDAEISDIMETFPWYLQDDAQYVQTQLPPSLATVVTWMRHVLQSAICIQRVRMYRPFLNSMVGDSWQRCIIASTSALEIYKSLRAPDVEYFQRCQKMHVHAYQVFSVAIALSTFLLVEMPSNPQPIRADIDLVIEDLSSHSSSFDDSRWIPLIVDGCRVIRRILTLYDARCKRRQAAASNGAATGDESALQEEAKTALVPAISSVFGGETSARRYLERCFVENIANDSTQADADSSPSVGFLNLAAWDTLLNPAAQPGQWSDDFWTDMDACIGLSPGIS